MDEERLERRTSHDVEKLKELFFRSMEGKVDGVPHCFYLNEIGREAVNKKCKKSISFLVERLRDPNASVRFVAVSYLGNVVERGFDPQKKVLIREAVESMLLKEPDRKAIEAAKVTLRRILNDSQIG